MLKIGSLGIVDQIYDWIEDWLKDRQQSVVILGKNSSWTKVNSGVPQGWISVGAPAILINDIDESVSTNILKFADDTKI